MKSLNDESSQKVYSAMRSLYRLHLLEESSLSPQVLIDKEVDIFKKRIANLDQSELLYFAKNCTSYLAEQKVQTALEDESLANSFSKMIGSLN